MNEVGKIEQLHTSTTYTDDLDREFFQKKG
jgi:hypothetical protein